jgi:hypothetical protein
MSIELFILFLLVLVALGHAADISISHNEKKNIQNVLYQFWYWLSETSISKLPQVIAGKAVKFLFRKYKYQSLGLLSIATLKLLLMSVFLTNLFYMIGVYVTDKGNYLDIIFALFSGRETADSISILGINFIFDFLSLAVTLYVLNVISKKGMIVSIPLIVIDLICTLFFSILAYSLILMNTSHIKDFFSVFKESVTQVFLHLRVIIMQPFDPFGTLYENEHYSNLTYVAFTTFLPIAFFFMALIVVYLAKPILVFFHSRTMIFLELATEDSDYKNLDIGKRTAVLLCAISTFIKFIGKAFA